MASVYKPTGRNVYRVEFKDQFGKTRTVSSGMADKRAAESLGMKIEQDAEHIRAGMAPKNIEITGPYLGMGARAQAETITETIEAYLTDLKRRRKADATHRHRKYKLKRLASECGWKRLADITAASFTAYLGKLSEAGRSAGTANAYRDTLNAFLEWCMDQGKLIENPIKRVRRSEGNKDRPFKRRTFTPDELRALLAAAPKHRDRYLVAALTGLRGKELSLVERRDFDLDAKLWTCRPEVDKTGRAWRLPILPDLLPTLRRLCNGLAPTDRLFPKRIGNCVFDTHLLKAQIVKVAPDGRRVNFHSLRYFFCTLLAKRLPIQIVQRLMRHGDIRRTVNLYLDLGLDDLAAAILDLPSLFDPNVPPADPQPAVDCATPPPDTQPSAA